MVQADERARVLKDLAITEMMIEQWKRLGHKEASWINQHEFKEYCRWAKQRHDFIQDELDQLLPAKPKKKPPPSTPAIVSHRTGRPRSGGNLSTYGERFG